MQNRVPEPRYARDVPSFLVVLDADSTLLENEVIELVAREAGREDEVREATEAAMRGEVDFAASLRTRVRALAGVRVEAWSRVIDAVTPTKGARELADAVHAKGGHIAVVSGGFHEVLDTVCPAIDIDVWAANRLSVRDGMLTGEVDGEIVGPAQKRARLREWADQYGAVITIAAGDGANDLDMIKEATLGLAFNAKPRVRAEADLVIGTVDLAEIIPLLPR